MINLFEDADACQRIEDNLRAGKNWHGSSDLIQDAANPSGVGEGPFVSLDTFNNAIKHLHHELGKVTGATVDIDNMRYECHPTVAAYISHLESIVSNVESN
jgi:hypothetical protein